MSLTRFLRGEELRAFRKLHRLSAAKLAARLVKDAKKGTTFSRPYVKRVESGGLRASPRFVKAFDDLRATLTDTPSGEPRSVNVIVHHKLPENVQEFETLAPCIRCTGCRKYFIPVTPNQKRHNTDACQRAARRTRRKAHP